MKTEKGATYKKELSALVSEFKSLAKRYPRGDAPSECCSEMKCAALLACTFACGHAALVCGMTGTALFSIIVALFFLADLHSGLAHVMLDDWRTYHVAPIFQSAVLEFQAHHEFSRDLVVRNVYDVCWAPIRDGGPAQIFGTIAAAAAFACAADADVYQLRTAAATFAFALCCKLTLTMYGQLSHIMAHTRPADVGTLPRLLRTFGLMMSHEHHRGHHDTYDKHFGVLNGATHLITELVHANVAHPYARVALASLLFLDAGSVSVAALALWS